MTPPISSDVKKKLEKLYYSESNFFGRDNLFKLARERYRCISKTDSRFFKKTRIISIVFSGGRK